MHILTAVFFGAIQGLTEFLPISSSGHLVILHWLFPKSAPDTLSFDVALHAGTLIAVVAVFWSELWAMAGSAVQGKRNEASRLFWLVVTATIPAGIIGGLFGDKVEAVVRQPWLVAVLSMLVGLVFLASRRWEGKSELASRMAFSVALAIGLAQALAIVPGVSRSGITILAAIIAGLSVREAARFSFLLSVPTILGAVALTAKNALAMGFPADERNLFLAGLISSAVVGAIAIRWLIDYFRNRGLAAFGWYRIILGFAVLAIFFLR